MLGAAHPDNPYFGTAARLMYLPQFDTGTPQVNSKSDAYRFVAGVKGTWNAWDFDTGVVYSRCEADRHLDEDAELAREERAAEPDRRERRRRHRVQPGIRRAAAGHVVAHRRERRPQLRGDVRRAACRPGAQGYSKLYSADFKVSREFGQLQGGPMGVAFGVEIRREDNELPLYTGLGDYRACR